MRRGLVGLVVGVLAVAVSVAWADAEARGHLPLAVQTASVTQPGEDVVWSLEMRTPFSPEALGQAGRTLCLIIERLDDGEAFGQLCLVAPRTGETVDRLQYRRIIGIVAGQARLGPPLTVAATITRAGSRQLTAAFPPSALGSVDTPIRWQVRSTLAVPHCATPKGTACVTLWPAKGHVAQLHAPQPIGCTATGPPFVGGITTSKREIALTFDDGPWYQTPEFLALLERYKVPATFFEIGEHIAPYGEGGAIERRMLADGDMIGDHTWSHVVVAEGGAEAASQIEEAAAAIRSATHGFTPCLFRAPDGSVSPALVDEARSLGFTTIQWDVDPRDWALPGVGEIEDNVVANAHPGAIVIMHDGGGDRSETLDALPDIIHTLRARGYTFVTVTQLLGQHLTYRS
jgi:peptidoglycan/xylan/chitin deacetylase (PgdA/CDA1 family)